MGKAGTGTGAGDLDLDLDLEELEVRVYLFLLGEGKEFDLALDKISPELEERGRSGLLVCFSEICLRAEGDCQLSSELRLMERSRGVGSLFLFFRGLSFLFSCFFDLLFNFLSSLSTAESRGLELSRFFFCLKIVLMILGLVFTSLEDLDFLSSSELSEGEADS